MIDRNGYRLNVGIVITNKERKLFWGKRIGKENAWQFPQGGVQPFETLKETLFRELSEETGLQEGDVEIIATSKRWLYYDLPHHMRRHMQKPLCVGQKQKWFLLVLKSEETRIRLNHTCSPEFDKWCWVDYWQPMKHVIYFKRETYRRVLEEFEPIIKKAIIRR